MPYSRAIAACLARSPADFQIDSESVSIRLDRKLGLREWAMKAMRWTTGALLGALVASDVKMPSGAVALLAAALGLGGAP